jgi:Ca2+-binding EF-hand superfamily protein
MRKLTLSLIAGAAALAAGGAAYAQAPQATQHQPQHQPLTRAAVEQRTAKAFERLDANKDGKLDQADRTAREKARFDRVDANHDGSVSYAEFTAMHTQHDGAGKERFAQRGEHADRAGRAGQHRMAFRDASRGRGGMTRLADADKDGAITRAEFQAAALQRFDRLDADKDGTVSPDEAKAARDSLRQRWQARRDTRTS